MAEATQNQLAAAFAAATPLVDAAIADAEGHVPIFARRQAEQAVEQHRAEIDEGVKRILKAGVNAALAMPTG